MSRRSPYSSPEPSAEAPPTAEPVLQANGPPTFDVPDVALADAVDVVLSSELVDSDSDGSEPDATDS